jgi:hypothetical protein
MKKKRTRKNTNTEELLPQYDFSKSRPNPYARQYASGTNVVLLDRDVAEIFPDSESVNRALRAVGEILSAARSRPRQRKSKRKKAA